MLSSVHGRPRWRDDDDEEEEEEGEWERRVEGTGKDKRGEEGGWRKRKGDVREVSEGTKREKSDWGEGEGEGRREGLEGVNERRYQEKQGMRGARKRKEGRDSRKNDGNGM